MPATVIQHAFEIGDRVFALKSRIDAVRKPCDACLGTKILHIRQPGETRERRRKCSYCYGTGTMPNGEQRSWRVGGPVKITGIDVERSTRIDEEGERRVDTSVRYRTDGTWPLASLGPDEAYATRARAAAACRKLNATRAAPPTKEAA